MEPPPPGFSQHDNGQIIPLARSLGHGRSSASVPTPPAPLTDALDRPPRPGDALMQKDLASVQKLGFLLDGPIRTLSQAAMVYCLMNRDIPHHRPGRQEPRRGRGNRRLRQPAADTGGAPWSGCSGSTKTTSGTDCQSLKSHAHLICHREERRGDLVPGERPLRRRDCRAALAMTTRHDPRSICVGCQGVSDCWSVIRLPGGAATGYGVELQQAVCA